MSVKEKELQIKEDELEAKSGHHTPEGLFTKPTKDIVDGLLKDANGDEELALRRITFYINRAGDGLSNKTAVHAAKRELEKKVEAKMEANKLNIHDILSEYFSEAYNTMFEDDDPKPAKKGGLKAKVAKKKKEKDPKGRMRYANAIQYLIDNDINPYIWLASPRIPWYVEKYGAEDPDKGWFIISGVNNDGTIRLLNWDKKNITDNGVTITADEFKNALTNERNDENLNKFNRKYVDVQTIQDILNNGHELYDAWMNRFYNEYKDEYDLKSPHSYDTHKRFKAFWDGLSDYEKSTYAQGSGVSDKYGLATKDYSHGMPIAQIRQKASPKRLNGKVTHLSDLSGEEWERLDPEYLDAVRAQTREIHNIRSVPTGDPEKPFVYQKAKEFDDKGNIISWEEISKEEYDKIIGPVTVQIKDPDADLFSDEEKSKLDYDNQPKPVKNVMKWLKKFDLDPEYAVKPVKDRTNPANPTEWKVSQAVETHNAGSPVRFILTTDGGYKQIMRPDQLEYWLDLYNESVETMDEAYGRSFGAKKQMKLINNDEDNICNFLKDNGIDEKFYNDAPLYGRGKKAYRIIGYRLPLPDETDPEKMEPMIRVQDFNEPIERQGKSTIRVSGQEFPLSTIQKWASNEKNQNSQSLSNDQIASDPWVRQRIHNWYPGKEKKKPNIHSFDPVSFIAKHGVK